MYVCIYCRMYHVFQTSFRQKNNSSPVHCTWYSTSTQYILHFDTTVVIIVVHKTTQQPNNQTDEQTNTKNLVRFLSREVTPTLGDAKTRRNSTVQAADALGAPAGDDVVGLAKQNADGLVVGAPIGKPLGTAVGALKGCLLGSAEGGVVGLEDGCFCRFCRCYTRRYFARSCRRGFSLQVAWSC